MKKVLVVDDTKSIRETISTCLDIYGYDVITASNGEEALELFKNKDIDFAFLDIRLPKLSGTEVLKYIRNKGLDTPVVIMTAFATVKNAVECTQLGAVYYLQKPFTIERFKSILDEINIDIRTETKTDKLETAILEIKKMIEHNLLDESLKAASLLLQSNHTASKVYELLSLIYSKMGDKTMADKFSTMGKMLSQ